jgi:hypothetical protein
MKRLGVEFDGYQENLFIDHPHGYNSDDYGEAEAKIVG